MHTFKVLLSEATMGIATVNHLKGCYHLIKVWVAASMVISDNNIENSFGLIQF